MSDTASGFGWYERMTMDTEAAAAFYKSVVGWTVNPVESLEMPCSTFTVDADGTSIGVAGLMTLPKEAGPMPAWIGYIHVPDVDAKVKEVVAGGGTVMNGRMEVPGGSWVLQGQDPQGAFFALLSAVP